MQEDVDIEERINIIQKDALASSSIKAICLLISIRVRVTKARGEAGAL